MERTLTVNWIRSKVGFRLVMTILVVLALSIGYMAYVSHWLTSEFRMVHLRASGGRLPVALTGDSDTIEPTIERVFIQFVSITLIFLAAGIIGVTALFFRYLFTLPHVSEPLSFEGAEMDSDELLMEEEDLEGDESDDLTETLPSPLDHILEEEDAGVLASSYSKMFEVMQRINEIEKQHSIELARANEQLQSEISERKRAEAEIRHLSNRLISGIEEARKNLAQDLHDEFGQTLAALHIEAESLMNAMPSELHEQRGRIDDLVDLIETLGDKIRSISSDLRPDLLDDLGLVPTLRWYIDEFAGHRQDLQIDFQAVGFRKRFSSEIELALYRVFQEALNNVIKHARATRFSVTLTYSHPKIIFILKDDGIGFDQDKSTDGIGLLGMRERVVSVDGTIAIISGKRKGTTIRVELPVLKENPNEE
jgi:signal transduction histidine kinase